MDRRAAHPRSFRQHLGQCSCRLGCWITGSVIDSLRGITGHGSLNDIPGPGSSPGDESWKGGLGIGDGHQEHMLSDEGRVSRHMARLYHYIARTPREEILARGEDPDCDTSGELGDLCAGGRQLRGADGDVLVRCCLLVDGWQCPGDMDFTRLYSSAHQARYGAHNPKLPCVR